MTLLALLYIVEVFGVLEFMLTRFNNRQGITGRLMDRFEEEAIRAGFRYITLGSDADGFYEKCGYRKIYETERQNIYQKLL